MAKQFNLGGAYMMLVYIDFNIAYIGRFDMLRRMSILLLATSLLIPFLTHATMHHHSIAVAQGVYSK